MMTNVPKNDIIQLVADMETCNAADLAAVFNIPLDTAVKRLKRMSMLGYFTRTVQDNGRSEYTIKTVNVEVGISAKAQMTKILNFMKETHHPDLKLVPLSKGGTNTGGGYLYQWQRLLMIQQQMIEYKELELST